MLKMLVWDACQQGSAVWPWRRTKSKSAALILYPQVDQSSPINTPPNLLQNQDCAVQQEEQEARQGLWEGCSEGKGQEQAWQEGKVEVSEICFDLNGSCMFGFWQQLLQQISACRFACGVMDIARVALPALV